LIDSNYLDKDILNKVLLDIFHNSSYINNEYSENKTNKVNLLLNFILNNLKYKNMSGVRLEAKGRLTRRFTASRSVFKIK
jgi:hypothetical protein